MNCVNTLEILKVLNKYIATENIDIQTETNDRKGLHNDFLSIDDNDVRIEVSDNSDDGIIIGYFTDHIHFDDLVDEPQDGEPNYLERAKQFIDTLFTSKIKQVNYYRKGKLVKDKYYFINENDVEEYIGGSMNIICLFVRKNITKTETVWQYDKEKQRFVKCASNKENV